ncbi:hypothetical protein [Paenibacillus sp. RC67]|uniref:hypothetical protein n=1 Tax=Paenibacillus sp. RC67 TaxID=3039392 RepID=UPI0024AD9904|nr:hypothetical protein [Paenibacillus sp. RC67]
MKLLQLLLNNWYMLVILFIILSNIGKMFKSKSSNEPGKQASPKQSMPPFAGGGSGWGRTVKQTVTQAKDVISRSEQPKKRPEPKPREQSKTAQRTIPELETVDVWKDSPLESNRQIRSNRDSSHRTDSGNTLKRPSANLLAQGVIWAEILGPPRAKKPFRK